MEVCLDDKSVIRTAIPPPPPPPPPQDGACDHLYCATGSRQILLVKVPHTASPRVTAVETHTTHSNSSNVGLHRGWGGTSKLA